MAADIALRARANLLVLFHLSPRYKNIGDILKKVRKKYFVYKDYKLYFLNIIILEIIKYNKVYLEIIRQIHQLSIFPHSVSLPLSGSQGGELWVLVPMAVWGLHVGGGGSDLTPYTLSLILLSRTITQRKPCFSRPRNTSSPTTLEWRSWWPRTLWRL